MHVHKELNKKDTDVMHSGKNNLERNQFGNTREAGSWSDSVSSRQRNLGNRYLQAASLNTPVSQKATLKNRTPIIQRKCACGGSCASCAAKDDEKKRIQAKLKVGPANDIYEQEADRVAEQIMRMPESRFGHNISRVPAHRNVPETIQTKLTVSEPGDKYEREADRVAARVMRSQPTSDGPKESATRVSSNSSRARGNLDRDTKSFMEARFAQPTLIRYVSTPDAELPKLLSL